MLSVRATQVPRRRLAPTRKRRRRQARACGAHHKTTISIATFHSLQCISDTFRSESLIQHRHAAINFVILPALAKKSPSPPNTPQAKLALKAVGDFTDPQYLASTAETTITADIQAQAQALNNDPLQIYQWVRNNVEWQPTWGGQQTADMTLDVKRGNAMDIATLLIALLRSAGIPARYAYGTVDVPAAQFLNTAGNFSDIDAAWDFASAGGIPIIGVSSGGLISKLRIEHVWVEAAVPYNPARGAKPVSANNPIDTWVPLDPSYKLYNYLSGIDVQMRIPANVTDDSAAT